ncbi:MAG: hypothetical protein WCJ72_13210 [Chryseobacterium sp.]
MKLNFKNWFQNEVATVAATAGGSGGMTSTVDVAKFARPLGIGVVTRTPPTLLTVDDLEKKKKKKSKILKMFPNLPDVVMGDIGYF